jgi:transposase InsO family protein
MATKRKQPPTEEDNSSKRQNTSDDFVFYEVKKLHKIPQTRIGKRPIYKFFIDFDDGKGNSKQFPVRAMLDLGSTSFTISPQCVKAFKVPVVRRKNSIKAKDFGGNSVKLPGMYTIPLSLAFGNHRSLETFEVVPMQQEYDVLIPAWYLEKHKAKGTTYGHLHFTECGSKCYGHGKKNPDWDITYDERIVFSNQAINIGSIIFNATKELSEKLPRQYHKWLLLFDPQESEKLPKHGPHDHEINLKTPDDQVKVGPIYQLSREEERLLREYIEKMILEGKIQPSQGQAGSPILFVPKPNGRGLRLCVDYRRLNDLTIKDKTALPLMDELQNRMKGAKWITKLDMKSGYHLIRMAKGHEWKTAFRTKFGSYEYMVMPFGLTNAPATFQRWMNGILQPFLGHHVDVTVCYIDDVMIATKGTKEEHHEYVGKILQVLQDNELVVEIDKCEFDQQQVEFLGFLVSGEGLKMAPSRSVAITQWPMPKSQKEVQIILGLWNFYRRFIKGYAGIVAPITDTLKGDGKNFSFGDAQKAAYYKICILFASENTPILRHYEEDRPAIIETDASDFAMGAVLSQKFEDGKIHPVAFISKKFSPAEMNYQIYDKEMLAIVYSMKTWRCYLQGAIHTTIVFSDHMNLQYFKETNLLNRRQARWAEVLQEYNFKIVYRKGSANGKADALSRCPEFISREGGTESTETKALLGPELWVQMGALEMEDNEIEEIVLAGFSVKRLTPTIMERWNTEVEKDTKYQELLKKIKEKEKNVDERLGIDSDGMIVWKGRLLVPEGFRKEVLKKEHDSKIAGHFGRERTIELITRNFYWPGLEEEVRNYCNKCDSCQRTKAPRHAKHGLLHPLELPSSPWTYISVDFITDLPESNGCKNIMVVVDRFTKMAHFIPTAKRESSVVARLFLDNVWKYHGLPLDVVSDRDGVFTGHFIADLYEFLGIKRSMSTAFHPQTDGQTERLNQTIEHYLRTYCNYEQDNWKEMLSMAEYAYNNSKHAATKITPFYANYGYEPRTSWPVETQFRNPSSELYAHYMVDVYRKLESQLEDSREKMGKYYDRKRKPAPDFKVNDWVMLDGRNIRTKRQCRKLDDKLYGPFKITKVGSNKRWCRLDLPTTWKIHPTFNVALLERYRGDIKERDIPAIEADNEGWIPEAVIASGPTDDDHKKHVFLVKWEGYTHEENTWESYDHLMEVSPELVDKFYEQHPEMEKDKRWKKVQKKKKRRT